MRATTGPWCRWQWLPRTASCTSSSSSGERRCAPFKWSNEALMSWWVMAFFLAAGLLGMPLAFALGAAAIGGLWMSNVDFNMLPQRMMAAVNSFPLMAIPLFMVAGELM